MWPFSRDAGFDPEKDISSLAGKVVLVTGGNAGIGKETVLQLAKHQPKQIFLAARTESKAKDAILSIESQVTDAHIGFVPLDLTSLKSVQAAAESVRSQTDRLDIVILNAGIMAGPPGKTEAGHEIQLGTNHIGHFLLVKELLPLLEQTASRPDSDVRVVAVASEAHQMGPSINTITSTEKLAQAGSWTRYGASKASNIMFAAELARRHPSLTSVSIHPGLIKTNLYTPGTTASFAIRNFVNAIEPFFFMDVKHGAHTQLFVAAGTPKAKLINGGYYKPFGAHSENKWSTNKEYGRKLWDWTESELKSAGF